MSDNYSVNVLVNGSRCKQYFHNGKTFIEAKKGSEYTIEVKNDNWQRILAVCSVDGLDVLNGKPATVDGAGYVINHYGTLRIDGFRVSNEKVAKFLFDYKGGSYAASKEDGSERNVGVIGVRLFQEKVKPAPIIVKEEHHHHHHDYWWNRPWTPTPYNPPYNPPTIWCDGLLRDGTSTTYGSTLSNSGNSATEGTSLDWMEQECERGPEKYCGNSIPTKSGGTKGIDPTKFTKLSGQRRRSSAGGTSGDITAQSMMGLTRGLCGSPAPESFDMGTKWGEAKESRVTEVEFEKGLLALTSNIYYASRQSLIEMGVPIGNERQVSFPEPFDDKYAKPPKNWVG